MSRMRPREGPSRRELDQITEQVRPELEDLFQRHGIAQVDAERLLPLEAGGTYSRGPSTGGGALHEHPLQPGVHPFQPGVRPPRPGEHPLQPGTHPPRPGEHPLQPGTHPLQPGEHPPQPGHAPASTGCVAQPLSHAQRRASSRRDRGGPRRRGILSALAAVRNALRRAGEPISIDQRAQRKGRGLIAFDCRN